MAPPQRHALSCEQVLDLLELFLDGELTQDIAAQVTTHIEMCHGCKAEIDFADEIRRELSRLPRFDAPHAVVAKARDAEPKTHRRFANRFMGPALHRHAAAALAAAAVVALGTAIVLLSPRTTPDPSNADAVAIERATTEAELAFALIADATRRAEDELMGGILKERVLGTAVRGISRSFEFSRRQGRQPAASPVPDPTPKQGGMT